MKRIYYIYRGATRYKDRDECWWTREFHDLAQGQGSLWGMVVGTPEARCNQYLLESERFLEVYCITDGSEGQLQVPPPGAVLYFPRERPPEPPPRVDGETARLFGRGPEVVEPKAVWEEQ